MANARKTAKFVFVGGPVPADVCRHLRSAMDAGAATPADVLDDGFTRDEDARRALEIEVAVVALQLAESQIEALRADVERFFGMELGEREGASLLRYRPGGFYGPHRDRGNVPAWPDAARRRIAIVLFLNASRDGGGRGDFDGGVLRVFADDGRAFEIVPREGMVVAFPADLVHEVTIVAGGTRDAVVDWFYAP